MTLDQYRYPRRNLGQVLVLRRIALTMVDAIAGRDAGLGQD